MEIEHLLVSKIFTNNRQSHIKTFCIREKLPIGRYITLKRDLAAIAIEGFSIKWHTEFCYIVTRLSLLGKAAAKIHRDKTKVIVVISEWTTQLVLNPLGKKNKKHDCNTNSKKISASPGSSKSLSTTSKPLAVSLQVLLIS